MERHRQPLEVQEQPGPEFKYYLAAHLADRRDERRGTESLDPDTHAELGHHDDDRPGVLGPQQRRNPVDRYSDQPGTSQPGEVREHDYRRDPDDGAPVRPEKISEQRPAAPAQHQRQALGEFVDLLGGDATPLLGAGWR